MISLRPVTLADAAALAAFERENADGFERYVPARSAAALTERGQEALISELMANAAAGEGQAYLIWLDAQIVGRVNLTGISDHVARLGYRVGQRFTGRGIATTAVGLAMKVAALQGITRLEAEAASSNPASCSVLRHLGFTLTGESRQTVLNGQSLQLDLYSRTLA